MGIEKRNISTLMKKRFKTLFFINFTLIALVLSFLVFWQVFSVSLDLLLSIYLVLAVLYLVILTKVKQKADAVDMEYKYLHLLDNKKEPYEINKPLYDQTWYDHIRSLGFVSYYEGSDYKVFYQYIKTDRSTSVIKNTLITLVISMGKKTDFYSDSLDKVHKSILKIDHNNKAKRQIVLQFENYPVLNKEAKDNAEKIINFKASGFSIIHLSVAYGSNSNLVYYLDPIRKYPSKHYYYASQMIKKVVYIDE